MDKFEYKIKADEIKELIAQKEYEQAAEIADSIDWRRVKSVMMLCTVSDLYKMCRRYEDSRDLLLLAYDRHPGGRTIIYSLCELSIKMEEFLPAIEYYKEYVQIAPKDTGRYILQYKLYEAQDVSLEERIAVLEELKRKEYREKWAYELAYLYHRVGLATKCVEECDELFLWFGDGKYVIKALELKMLHAPLTAEQQYKYDSRFGTVSPMILDEKADVSSDTIVMPQIAAKNEVIMDGEKQSVLSAETTRIPEEEIDIQVKTLDVGKYDTINLQEELAAGIQEYFGNAGKETITQSILEPLLSDKSADITESVKDSEAAPTEEAQSEVFFGETGEIADVEQMELPQQEKKEENDIAGMVMSQMRTAEEKTVQQASLPQEMANVLSMEGDGQISFVLPERTSVEKQITGQISINDIILEWERLKKENEEKRKNEVRQHVLQQTGPMFTEFEASVRDGLLEKLESGQLQGENPEEELAQIFVEREQEPADIGEVEELTDIENVPEEELVRKTEVTAEAEEPEAEVTFEEEEPEAEMTFEEEEPEAEMAFEEEEPEAEMAFEEEEPEAEVTSEEEEKSEIREESAEVVQGRRKVRGLTREERELYGSYIQGRAMKEQLIGAIDAISMAAYTGNVIVTGDEGMDSIGLAKNIIREIQITDSNFSGKIAKISGESLNTRDVKQIVEGLNNGALIIQKASKVSHETAEKLYAILQKENLGIVIVLEDNRKTMDRFLNVNRQLAECFTARVDVAALSNDALVAFAKKYAKDKEYSIDEFGLLALHTRIEDMQTSDHAVTVMDVKEIVDEAIEDANRSSIGHFFDVIFGKRYDDDDMIILKEKNFM